MKENQPLIIFDGVCNLCHGAVNFIIKRDKLGLFLFTTMQSDYAQELIKSHGISDPELDTFLLIKDGKIYERSNAALEITKDLSGLWYWLRIFLIVPTSIRDILYNLIAKNRYRVFGKKDQCMVPTPELQQRFLQ